MPEYDAAHLRVTPEAIPTLRAAFEKAIELLRPEIKRLGDVGHIKGRWLGDPVSAEVVAFYNDRVMDAADGPYQALVLYQEELMRVRDQLTVMQQMYERNEDEVGATFTGGAL